MLVLSRKIGESLVIGSGDTAIRIQFVGFGPTGQVKLGIEAPREVSILRSELIGRGRKEDLPPATNEQGG